VLAVCPNSCVRMFLRPRNKSLSDGFDGYRLIPSPTLLDRARLSDRADGRLAIKDAKRGWTPEKRL